MISEIDKAIAYLRGLADNARNSGNLFLSAALNAAAKNLLEGAHLDAAFLYFEYLPPADRKLPINSCITTFDDRKLGEVLNAAHQKNRLKFENLFFALSKEEQTEIMRIMTTWDIEGSRTRCL